MATTNIELDIENITGVTDANAQFIISAQKFVVASVPKNLLKWAASLTDPASHGGNTSQGINIVMPTATDSILDVSRNGFSASEVPYNMKGFIANPSSLHLATNTYPKYYLDNAVTDKGVVVSVKPIPTDSEAARVLYVDFSKIDDDCDLRNAVIFHAVSNEFSKLASSKVASWSSISIPIAPILSDSSITFNSVIPIFTKPTRSASTIFNDYWTLGDFGDNDPGALSVSASIPNLPVFPSFTTPSITSTTITNVGAPPTYIPPTIPSTAGGSTTASDLTLMSDSDWTNLDYDFDDENIDVATWFQTLGDMIQNQEDVELANAQMQKIQTYVGAYTQAMQNKLNQFNESNVAYQAKLQEALQQAQINANKAQQETNLKLQKENQEYVVTIQRYNAELGTYQADVNKQIQEYVQKMARYNLELNTVYQSWVKSESDKIEVYKSDIQNESAVFNQNNAQYQAELQVAIQEAQLISQDDSQKLQKFSNDIQEYQSKINEEVQKLTASNKDSMFYTNESKKYYEWSQLEINSYIKNNSKMIGLSMQANQQSQQQG